MYTKRLTFTTGTSTTPTLSHADSAQRMSSPLAFLSASPLCPSLASDRSFKSSFVCRHGLAHTATASRSRSHQHHHQHHRHQVTKHQRCSPSHHVRRAVRCAVATPPLDLPPAFDGEALRRRLSTPEEMPPTRPVVGMNALTRAITSHTLSNSARPVVVLFHGRWCRVCKTLRHKLPKVADDPRFKDVAFAWFDVDFVIPDNKPVCHALSVKDLPTFRVYKPGATHPNDHAVQFTAGPFAADAVAQHLIAFLRDEMGIDVDTGVATPVEQKENETKEEAQAQAQAQAQTHTEHQS